MTAVNAGEVLAGKYRIEKVLGTGGMGYVVACQHLQLQQKVALKFLHPSMLESEEIVGRFLREAQAAVQIKSEHVVRVSDVGTLDDDSPYMVMEYLEGTDLKEMIEKDGPLALSTAVDYLLQACEALAEAHVLGIVHRDLKPSNLFLAHKADGRPCVKVLDFGISKLNSSSPGVSSLTRTTATLGTPHYMAPEQLTSTRSVDARADIWALGVVLYELLSNALPFSGETLTELCIRIVQEQPAPLESVDQVVPEMLWSVLLRCLQKDREARYANVAEVAYALAPFGTASAKRSLDTISRIIPNELTNSKTDPAALSAKAVAPSPNATAVERAHGGTTGHVAWGQTKTSERRKSRIPLLLALGASLVVGLGVLGWFLRYRLGSNAVAASAPTGLMNPVAAAQSANVTLSQSVGSPLAQVAPATNATTAPVPAAPEGSKGQPVASASPLSLSATGVAATLSPTKAVGPKPKRTNRPSPGEQTASPNSESLIEDRR